MHVVFLAHTLIPFTKNNPIYVFYEVVSRFWLSYLFVIICWVWAMHRCCQVPRCARNKACQRDGSQSEATHTGTQCLSHECIHIQTVLGFDSNGHHQTCSYHKCGCCTIETLLPNLCSGLADTLLFISGNILFLVVKAVKRNPGTLMPRPVGFDTNILPHKKVTDASIQMPDCFIASDSLNRSVKCFCFPNC